MKAIFRRTGAEVKAEKHMKDGEEWYNIEFSNGASIDVKESEIELKPDKEKAPRYGIHDRLNPNYCPDCRGLCSNDKH